MTIEKLKTRSQNLKKMVQEAQKPYRQRNLKKQYRRLTRRLSQLEKKQAQQTSS